MKKYILMAFLLSFLTSNLFAFADDSSSVFPTEATVKEKFILTLKKALGSPVSISEESIELDVSCGGWFSWLSDFFDYHCGSDITYYTVNDIQLTIDDEKSIVLEECEVFIEVNRKAELKNT